MTAMFIFSCAAARSKSVAVHETSIMNSDLGFSLRRQTDDWQHRADGQQTLAVAPTNGANRPHGQPCKDTPLKVNCG
jgi:hypothetical protein